MRMKRIALTVDDDAARNLLVRALSASGRMVHVEQHMSRTSRCVQYVVTFAVPARCVEDIDA